MRRRAIAAVTALVSGLVTAAAHPAVAAPRTPASTPAPGSYTAVTPVRVLDTRVKIGVGTTTPVASKKSVTFTVAGKGVPTTASAVVLNLTATGATAGGYLTAFAAGGATPGVSNVNFAARQTKPNLAIVPLGTGGKVTIYNGSTGSVHVLADLSGFYTGGTMVSGQQGAFGRLTPTRLLDTRAKIGVATTTPVPAGKTVTFAVEGRPGIPNSVSAVALNITATAGSADGYLRAYASDEAVPNTSNVNWSARQTVPSLAVVRTGSKGTVTIYNGSSASVHVVADVQGYWTAGDPVLAGALGALPPSRVLSARTIAARATLRVPLGGLGGVPRTNVSSNVVGIAANHATAGGYLTVYGTSQRPAVSTLNFATGRAVANLAEVAPSSDGSISIYNGSDGSVQVYVDTQAYVNAPDLTVPPTTTSRYVSDLNAISQTGSGSEGCADGRQAPDLVLLDVGAQTITELGADDPGVALVFTDPVERVDYAGLVDALRSYLDAFVACEPGNHVARVAVGTNNSGAFTGTTAYAAATRGKDWADQVVDKLNGHPGVQVLGAIDLEAGFSGSEADAEAWITNYLANTTTNLINNGSADNCPATFGSTAECGPVHDENGLAKTWTRAQYVHLSYGLKPGRISVLPQIYLAIPDQAAQWANIDATAGGKLVFEGALTQRGVCNCGQTPPQAWAALFHAKATQVYSPSVLVATDLQPH